MTYIFHLVSPDLPWPACIRYSFEKKYLMENFMNRMPEKVHGLEVWRMRLSVLGEVELKKIT